MVIWFAACSVVLVAVVFQSPGIDYRWVIAGSVAPLLEQVTGGPKVLHSVIGAMTLLLRDAARKVFPQAETVLIPMADGGEGTVDALLRAKRSFESDALTKIMADVEPGRSGQQTILNAQTRHSVVMEPRYKRIHIAFPDPSGKLGKPVTISLRKTTP